MDPSLTVTFWPAAVDSVKLAVDTPATVPDAPPSAGPDRALDPAAPLAAAEPVLAAAGLLEVALTSPYEPPATGRPRRQRGS